jgi:hypothetical protein
MLNIVGESSGARTSFGRRGFLSVGTLAAGGLTLAELLRHRQAQASETRRPTSVIFFFQAGGASQIDTVDPKPTMSAEVRGPFSPIHTRLPGFSVCDLLPGHARVADKLAVIRSIRHHLSVHDDATHWLQTGYPLLNARQQGQKHPSQGSIVSALKGSRSAGIPPYVCIPEDYRRHMGFYEHAAFLSSQHNALDAGGDPSLGNYRAPGFSLPADVTMDRLEDRRSLHQHLDRLARRVEASVEYGALDDIQRQALELTTGSSARKAFNLSEESEELRAAYGRHAYGQSALLARRLVEAGVSFVTINLYERDIDWWDDHTNIEANLRKRLPPFDQAVSTLIRDLDQRGQLDNVLVAVFGEFGRGPRIDAGAGRGHWPGAMSAVLAGGGIRGGQVIGATDAMGATPVDRPLGPGDLLASIYQVLGIDPEATIRDRQNRPIPILESGKPIAELFG